MTSRYLSIKQRKALIDIGNTLLPGDYEMPSFEATGCIEWVDDILAETPEQDVADLKGLLSFIAFCPAFFVEWLLRLAEQADRFPGFIGAQLRLLNLGLRGIAFSLYYSGLNGRYHDQPTVLDVMGYDIHCEVDER